MPKTPRRRGAVAIAVAAVLTASALAAGYIGGMTLTVRVEQLNGKTAHVLTTHDGMTLYYSTKDTPRKSMCTGSCTHTWKPFALVGKGKPTAPSKVLPHLSTLKRAKVIYQIEYNGHPLYTYSKDHKPGDTRGAGKGSFRVATMATPRAAGKRGAGNETGAASGAGASSGGGAQASGSAGGR